MGVVVFGVTVFLVLAVAVTVADLARTPAPPVRSEGPFEWHEEDAFDVGAVPDPEVVLESVVNREDYDDGCCWHVLIKSQSRGRFVEVDFEDIGDKSLRRAGYYWRFYVCCMKDGVVIGFSVDWGPGGFRVKQSSDQICPVPNPTPQKSAQSTACSWAIARCGSPPCGEVESVSAARCDERGRFAIAGRR